MLHLEHFKRNAPRRASRATSGRVATVEDGRKAANISLVAGALGLTLIPLIGAVVAIIAGHLARRTLPPGTEGRRPATVGLGLGYLGLVAPAVLILLGRPGGERDALLESRCRAALETAAPFEACSELIPDVALAAGFRRLSTLEPAQRRAAWTRSLQESASCRGPARPAFCEGQDGGVPVGAELDGVLRPVAPETRAALDRSLPVLLP